MPVSDSIPQISDSARLVLDSIHVRDSLLRDSVARVDSIIRADSLAKADSIQRHLMSGFEGTVSGSAPSGQWWVFVIMLALFGVVAFAVIRSIIPPSQIIKGLFDTKNKSSLFNKTSIDSLEQRVYFFVFSVVTISMLAYVTLYRGDGKGALYYFVAYTVAFLAFLLVKYLVVKLLEYVFFGRNALKIMIDTYLNILSVLSVLIYVYLLLYLYSPFVLTGINEIAVIIVIVISMLALVVVLAQNYLHKFVDFLYLMLYLCTLEIIPVIVLVQVFKEIANNLKF